MTVHPRSPLGALVLSIVLPGLGSMYAGAGAAGMLILVLYLLAWVWLGVAGVPAALLLAVGIAVWGIFHARRAAIRWNSRRGIVS
jgi:hypothetical protein